MGFGTTEIIVIAFVGLIVFGPSRLSKLGRAMGEGIGNFKAGIRDAEEAVTVTPEVKSAETTAAAPSTQETVKQEV